MTITASTVAPTAPSRRVRLAAAVAGAGLLAALGAAAAGVLVRFRKGLGRA
ncbi:hypothetical protein [Micrococcus endophyticus]|uniref:hypothetical protein n=1 Tax=Micrococcus endophyticus TaxID=455343 RepID=UPI0034CD21F9